MNLESDILFLFSVNDATTILQFRFEKKFPYTINNIFNGGGGVVAAAIK